MSKWVITDTTNSDMVDKMGIPTLLTHYTNSKPIDIYFKEFLLLFVIRSA